MTAIHQAAGGPRSAGVALPSDGRVLGRRAAFLAASALAVAIVLALGLLPMLRLVATALAPGGEPDLAGFAERLSGASAIRATLRTLDTAFFGAVLSLGLGGGFALAVAVTDMPGRRTAGFLFLLPLMIAPQVTALAFLQLVGPSSALLGAFGLQPPPGTPNPLLGREGIILLYGIQHAPIVFITLRAGLGQVPGDLVEAARASGAGPLRSLRTILLPLLGPYLVAAGALAFISGIGNFGIPALLGLSVNYLTLSTLIYQRLSSFGPDVLPDVAALSAVVAALALAGVAVQGLALSRLRHRLHRGVPALLPLGRWRWPLALAAFAAIGLILVLPGLALLATSLIPAFGVPLSGETATLANYAEVLTRQAATVRAFRNSTMLAGAAALILACIAVPVVILFERFGSRTRRLLLGQAELAYAIPGIVLAIACILLFLRPLPLVGSLYGTAAIILVAYLMRFFTLSLKPVGAAVGQIPADLGEAAAAAGAGPTRRALTITAPLALPAAVAGALLVFMTAFNELTVSALLWSGGTETLGVVLFSLDEAGLGPQAAAIAVTTIAVVVVLLLALDRLGRRLPPGVLPWR